MKKKTDISDLLPYPGRLILLGKDQTGENYVAVYAITGRSPSSQKRSLERDNEQVKVIPGNKDVLERGNPDLLIYPAMIIKNGIAVSNGKQTKDLANNMNPEKNPVDIFCNALKRWKYEPDNPHFTPRISGIILQSGRAGLCIIKRADNGGIIKNYFEFPLIEGKGNVLSTYGGKNNDPLPSFKGEPRLLDIKEVTAENTASDIYHRMAPERQEKDFRVAVVCVYWNIKSGEYTVHIINRTKG